MNKRSRNWKFSTLAIIAAAAAPVVRAQSTQTWTGASDNLWTNALNWNTAVPGASDTASFNGTGSNTTISLGGMGQSIENIQFAAPSATAGYTLGILGSGDTFNFGAGGMITTASNLAATEIINANINTNGNFTIANSVSYTNGVSGTNGVLTGVTIGGNISMTNGGTLTLESSLSKGSTTLVSGNITDIPGNPSSLTITSTATNTALNNFIITGNNTYSGTTLISVYTGNGSIEIGTDSAFGTGKVTFQLHGNPPAFSAYGGSHTITNNFDFNGGPVFVGTNSLTFTGSMNIINTNTAGSRTLNNEMSGGTVYFGTAGTSSTLTLGNPVSNGGDGAGKGVVFGASSNPGTTVVYDTIQDAGPGGGSSSGYVVIQQTGNVVLGGLNTYSGTTSITSNSNIIGIASSSNGPAGSFTAGPFGTGTIIFNNANGQHLRPLGGDRTVSNAITMESGLEMDNAAGDPSNLTLAGPITQAGGTLIQNGFGGTTSTFGTFILGNATAASTISMSGGQLKFAALNGPVVVNDVVQGSGTLNINPSAGDTGVVTFNAANTYGSTTTIFGGTLSVSSDGNLGQSANAVTLSGTSGATLLSTGTFTTARTINLSSGDVNTIDATSANTLTLTGPVSGGDLTKGTSGGTVELGQSGGYATGSNNVIVNGGVLALGSASNGGATGPLTVSAGALTINSGAKFAVLANGLTTNTMTNVAATLTINGSGQLDLANSQLLTTTPSSTVRQYLVNGFNNGAWNGTGGITSVNAAGDFASNGANATRALGFASGTGAVGMSLGLSPTQTLVKFTIYGDADLSGGVDISDLNIVLNNFLGGNTWDTGDMYYSGSTDISDLNAVLNNFFASAPVSSRPLSLAKAHAAAASVSTAHTLTGTASPDANPPTPAFNTLELVVNTSSGDVQIIGNNTQTGDTQITSSSNGIITANWHDLKSQGFSNWQDTAKKAFGIGEFDTQFAATGDFALINTIDYGNIYNTTANAEDYIFKYGAVDQTTGLLDTLTGSVFYVSGVPEPTTLSLIGIGAVGLLARRRNKRRS